MDEINVRWHHWHYKNTTLLVLSVIVFFFLSGTSYAQQFIAQIGNLGYLGAFFVGALFVSSFTIAPAIVILFDLAKTLDPVAIALVTGAGGVVGDYLMFKYLKDRVFEELTPVIAKAEGRPLRHLLHTPYFAWLTPVIGAIIIASPFPDEVGISMLGLSKVKDWQFLALVFLLDVASVFLVVLAARTF